MLAITPEKSRKTSPTWRTRKSNWLSVLKGSKERYIYIHVQHMQVYFWLLIWKNWRHSPKIQIGLCYWWFKFKFKKLKFYRIPLQKFHKNKRTIIAQYRVIFLYYLIMKRYTSICIMNYHLFNRWSLIPIQPPWWMWPEIYDWNETARRSLLNSGRNSPHW